MRLAWADAGRLCPDWSSLARGVEAIPVWDRGATAQWSVVFSPDDPFRQERCGLLRRFGP